MGKKQSRRSISVRGATYERLRVWCETKGISMSEFVEMRIVEHIGPDDDIKSYRPLPAVSQIARPGAVRNSGRGEKRADDVTVAPAVANPRPAAVESEPRRYGDAVQHAPPTRLRENSEGATPLRLRETPEAAPAPLHFREAGEPSVERRPREAESVVPFRSREPAVETPIRAHTPAEAELRMRSRELPEHQTAKPDRVAHERQVSKYTPETSSSVFSVKRPEMVAEPPVALRPAAAEAAVRVPQAPIEASRPIRVATPAEPTPRTAGRPAPTPASQVLRVNNKEKEKEEVRDRTDYRAIRF